MIQHVILIRCLQQFTAKPFCLHERLERLQQFSQIDCVIIEDLLKLCQIQIGK